MQQSELFRDLLTLPQPNDAETIDGCHVVWLEGMSAREVRLFLICLHNTTEYHRIMEESDFEEILLLLRICHKYIATHLEERIISHLSPMWPHSLEQFRFSEQEDKKLAAPFDYTSLACNVRIANLAREIGAYRLLPAALYRLCRYSPDHLLGLSLSSDNLYAVLVGRSRLSTLARGSTHKHLFVKAPSPQGRVCCRSARLMAVMQLCHADGWLDPLAPFDFAVYHGLCETCTRLAYESNHEGCLGVWNMLPEVFTLPESTWLFAANDRSNEPSHARFSDVALRTSNLAVRRRTRYRWLCAVTFVGGILWYYDTIPRIFRWARPSPPPSRWAMLWARIF